MINKETILIVDDESSIVSSLRRLMRNEHFNILTANNGQEALKVIAENKVAVLLTDNLMPVMTGLELVEKVKTISPQTIRIIMSGQSDMEAVLSAINKGEVYRFMLKPWDDKEMIITINLALAYYQLIQENRTLKEKLLLKEDLFRYIEQHHADILEEATKNILIEA